MPRLLGPTVLFRAPGLRGEREAGPPGREQEVRRGLLQHDGLPHHPQAGLPKSKDIFLDKKGIHSKLTAKYFHTF